MASKRHIIFNLMILTIPWLSLLFMKKKNLKRYLLSSVLIGIFEIINHMYGRKRKWWKFYDKRKFFVRDELPFDIGLFIPFSIWMLNLSFGNFKKYLLFNAISNGIFAFFFIDVLKKFKIVGLNRLSHFQFFLYYHYKTYILYALQYLFGKMNKKKELPLT
ncbi:hypothetical protein [Robertmurraya kyonggiensis]|uniref:Uncharacterized protein n=1 Tax=Robertmurraya kyonggiensis TaxID=1037680 RepID=A0A4U1D8T9_9BACI|nr:hypothetical protein [Robertmurraya kyonggiensis]TKC18969.1 hypothetical protein FA727_05330 [Robertmurraya kyonggiensis]